MKYIGQYTDSPRWAEQGKTQVLPRPNPGENEYRVYFNYREETREDETGAYNVPVADFVSCISEVEMTFESWVNLLVCNGFTQEKINNILYGMG